MAGLNRAERAFGELLGFREPLIIPDHRGCDLVHRINDPCLEKVNRPVGAAAKERGIWNSKDKRQSIFEAVCLQQHLIRFAPNILHHGLVRQSPCGFRGSLFVDGPSVPVLTGRVCPVEGVVSLSPCGELSLTGTVCGG